VLCSPLLTPAGARAATAPLPSNRHMHRSAISLAISLFVFPAFGAGMAHIASVIDSHTIAIEQEGQRTNITLVGVVVPPTDEAAAVDFLRRTTASGWVLVERDAAHPGEAWLYRSPDGLFINGEMIRAAYRDGGTRMTYLGVSSPGREEPATKRGSAAAQPAAATRARPARHVRR
jgi:hypothetical protein